jgi:hypothetical protein
VRCSSSSNATFSGRKNLKKERRELRIEVIIEEFKKNSTFVSNKEEKIE